MNRFRQLIPSRMVKSLSSSPHLCARDRGGSSHPSPGDGLDCPGRPEPAVLIQSLSQGGCQAAAGQRGEVAAGPEAREQHGRGAVPGAAAAVSRPEDRQTDTEWVGGKMRGETAQKHKADWLKPCMILCIHASITARIRQQSALAAISIPGQSGISPRSVLERVQIMSRNQPLNLSH